jgi:hypothetical protein
VQIGPARNHTGPVHSASVTRLEDDGLVKCTWFVRVEGPMEWLVPEHELAKYTSFPAMIKSRRGTIKLVAWI